MVTQIETPNKNPDRVEGKATSKLSEPDRAKAARLHRSTVDDLGTAS